MIKLIKIEWIKATRYTSFRVFILLHMILFLLVLYAGSRLDFSVPGFSTTKVYQFPYIWSSVSWLAGTGFFILLLAIPVLVMSSNEFAFRTYRQQLFSGLNRDQLFLAKLFLILMVAGYGTLLVFLASMVAGLLSTPAGDGVQIFSHMDVLLNYFLKSVGVLFFAYLISIAVRSTALSMVLFLLYYVLIEPVVRVFFPPELRIYFPAKVLGHLTPAPEFLSILSQGNDSVQVIKPADFGLVRPELDPVMNLLLGAGYLILFVLLSYWVLKKKDL